MTSHRLKWGSFPPNEVGRKGEGRKEGKDWVGLSWNLDVTLVAIMKTGHNSISKNYTKIIFKNHSFDFIQTISILKRVLFKF